MNGAGALVLGAGLLLGVGVLHAPGAAQRPAPAGLGPLALAQAARGSVSVKAFGAKGDGQTDDTAALNRAAAQSAGRDLIFPAGTYLLRGPVVFDGLRNQTVRGDGEATIRAAPEYARGRVEGMLHFQRPVNVTVQDLKIVGFRVANVRPHANVIDGVRVSGGKNVTLMDLQVFNAPTNGIAVSDSDTVTLRGNRMENAGGAGGWSHRTVHQRWLNNTVVGSGDPRTGGSGLGFFATIGDDFLAEGNVVKNVANTATKTEGVDHVVYRNNTVDVFGKDGIKVMPYDGHSREVRGAVVENNTVRAKRDWAPDGSAYILLHSVLGGQVRGNRVVGTGGQPEVYSEDAVKVNTWGSGTPSRDIVIEDNVISDTRRGMRIQAEGAVLRRNTVTGRQPWARSGVIVGAHGVQLTENVFDGPAVGVLLDRGFGRVRIENNRFARVETAIYAANDNPGVIVNRNQFGESVGTAVSGAVESTCNYYGTADCRAP